MAKSDFSVLILAAGEGTRMKSALPKVLHGLCGIPILIRVVNAAESLKPKSIGIVVGNEAGLIRKTLGERKSLSWIYQEKRLGSGHAVRAAAIWIRKSLKGSPNLLVLCGDIPLIKSGTLRSLIQAHSAAGNSVTVLSSFFAEPFGYGRIVKSPAGRVRKIVEEKDASPEEKKIQEVNSGIYCFDSAKLLDVLPEIKNHNAKKEYYLTDAIEILNRKESRVGSFVMKNGHRETLGINSRADLAQAETELEKDILKRWMEEGVTILNPSTVYIGEEVKIGRDTILLPGTMLLGKTVIGEGCKIGPNAYIENSRIGNQAAIRASFVYGSELESDVKIGPFTHLRPGTVVRTGARVGNFTEIKKSAIGKGAKVSHLSYVGDAEVGSQANVGAGVITCNFDGEKKHKTVIGKNSFIGSNVNLVAPVKVGEGAVVGAGSTVTKDVPAHALALERSEEIVKKNWVKKKKGRGP